MSQGNHVFSKENKGDSSMSKKNNLNLKGKIQNFTFKEKDEEKKSDNISENINEFKNEEINNDISLSNNKEMIYSQSNSMMKDSDINNNNNINIKNKDLSNLELNYIEMSKQLEELRHESSFLKNKLREISIKQNNFNKNNKSVGNTISFNKATFINIKKLKNIRYDDSWNNNHKIHDKEINNSNNKIKSNSRNLKKVKSSAKIKLPLFKSFYENSSNKKNHQLNINKTFINDIKNKILYTDTNHIKENNINNNFATLKLSNEKPTKLFPSNNLLFTHLESKKDNYNNLVNQLSDKNKIIKKLNHNLVEKNKLAEGKISLLIKDKNKINEKLNYIQKEKDEYKSKKESEIKQYMRDLKSDNKIIKELFNEKHKLLKSKRESEILNQKLKNIILEKRNELQGLYKPKKLSFDSNFDNINNQSNSYIKNIKQKYIDINNENKEIKNQILSLKKKLGINQKKELDMKKYMHNIYTYSSSKKLKNSNNKKLILSDKKGIIENNKNNSNDEIIEDSFNFEHNNIAENNSPFQKKYHSENTNISNNDTININNEEIKIFSKYINIIQENKANQKKISEIQNELNIKNETIKNLEQKLKDDLTSKETLIENMKKEKNELQNLLNIEKQKTLKLKLFAEEEQKKHIKYKNKFEKFKKSKTEEKNAEKKEVKENKAQNPDLDFFIYSNSAMFDENKSIAKLKEDILKLKQSLDKEKNKNEILQILSENEKEKHELVKNKYNKTKKLNITLINKIKEKEYSINNEIKSENEVLKKQLIDTENKNEELKQIIQKLNEEINYYKTNSNKDNKESKENNETNEHNMAINPINEIKEEKYKSEKKNNNLIFQKNYIFQDKKPQRFSVQMQKQPIAHTITQIPKDIPKSNKDLLLKPRFKKGKAFNSALKNQINLSIKTPSNKASKGIFLKEFSHSNMNLELNISDMNKEKDHSDLDLDLNKKHVKRRDKRDNSEKVIRIFNGNNISSSEFSSEKNLSENNRGTQIDNVIKENENENEDDDEKLYSEISGKKGSNKNIENKN